MKKMLSMAVLGLTLAAPAKASSITVFDTSTVFPTQIIAQNEFVGYGPIFFTGGTSGGVLSAFHNGNTYELAANNVSNTITDTLNIYALWQGITSPTGLLTVDTMMATDEYGAPGWTLSEVVYINGKIITQNTQTSLVAAPDQTFQVPVGIPFDLQLQLQYVSGPFNGDFGSYVIATLEAPHPVPGPIVGTGIPALIMAALGMIGLNRYRKRRFV